jgi:sigma-B regulation protein RsbU (phosphoserine phosphatase)
MYAGMLRSALDAARRRDPEPGAVMADLLAGIDFFAGSRYATMLYARLLPHGQLRYFSAGHPAAYLQRQDGRIEELPSTGLLLTRLFPTFHRQVREVRLEPGDRLLLVTDGLLEARDPADHEFGREGVQLALCEVRAARETRALEPLLERLRRHCGERPLADDVTLVLIERR